MPVAPWWQRLQAALMPDYNRRAAAYWWLLVLLGAVLLLRCVMLVAPLGWQAWAQIALGMGLAMGAGLFPVRVPGTKQSFVAGEIFIFLVLLLHGAPAAAMVAAAEALVATLRTSRRWTSRLVSPAIALIAMLAAGGLLQALLQQWPPAGWGGAAALLLANMGFAALYFLLNALGVAGVQRLKRNEAFFQLFDLFSVFRWVGLAYAGSAAVATLLFLLYQQQGLAVLMAMLPLLLMLLVTLHFYFRQQEAGEALREASADLAAREAALALREAETARRHLRELQASERRFHSAFTHASIGMALLDFDGRILQTNPAMAALLGRDEAELPQQYFQELMLHEDRPLFEQALGLNDRRDFESFARELRCEHADGSTLWLDLHCSHFSEPGLDTPCLILQAQDISARRRAEQGLAHLAFHDPLTGLPNRRRFVECLAGAVSRFQADRSKPWAVMFIDFDRFKLVNDSLGHNAGDELLKQMARRIQEKLRPSDIVARLGGDEFAILAERVEQERDAVVLAERLMEALRRPFVLGDVELIASASIGITFSALNYASAEDVLRDADTAMYKAKHAGKARYALFDASLHTAVAQRLRLEGELRQAIAQGQLAVEYQPVFELGPGSKLRGFEALVRWRHPRSGMLQPADFLPIAEESGLMLQLSDFVLHCACRQLRQWQLSDPALAELTMSINLSSHDLASPALVARVSRALVEAGLQPQHLTLELTENILMSHLEDALGALNELRRLGAQLAVDDFGTGHSSLSHLSKLPIDSLKIDRSFVAQLQPGSADAAVVEAIVRLGASLRKAVVAEGIESQDQMEQLRALGCGLGQGFHLAQPLSEAAAGEWLRSRRATLH
jgi:diguanylate cyclase (GGDEF)-like protein/PAS domain S-box-containing protein